ncbi:uncharacterized protein PV09_07772 [Verruconis gallopava]|uniref:Uncharacterized protein n=1 Tax=Verruconis gallopava TaxID=253628 RepID=A0A0D2A205_9PEZI|nr:uncharacterized protein PV09_07772 [Verruconis gallopava]KIW00793.1 hypothetical protein PV09_07772 [Verruconis gallopava]
MPMQWTADADAKVRSEITPTTENKVHAGSDASPQLFAAFIRVHEVKPVNLQALADAMGNGCTPKAISHRLAFIKKKGVAADSEQDASPSKPNNRARVNTVRTPKTPRSGTKSGGKNAYGKHTYSESEDEDTSHRSGTGSDSKEIKHHDHSESQDKANTPVDCRSGFLSLDPPKLRQDARSSGTPDRCYKKVKIEDDTEC